MAMSAVVLGFVTGTVVDAMRSQRRQTNQIAALNDAKLVFERVTRDIRRADPLRVAGVDRITLDVQRTDATSSVTYERVGNTLVATEAAAGPSRTLVGDLALGEPVFLFHLFDGSTSTAETPLDPDLVESITVRLRVEPVEAGWVVDLENRVVVRNARP